jgi:hypothetical protein
MARMTAGNEIDLHILMDHGSGSKVLTMRIRLRLEEATMLRLRKKDTRNKVSRVTWGIDQLGKRSEEEGNNYRWRNTWHETCKPFW